MCYCFHIVHEPLQVPNTTYDEYGAVVDDYYAMGMNHRRLYQSMVMYMDQAVGELAGLLRSKAVLDHRMWDDTLIVFQTDNGGPSFAGGIPTANNVKDPQIPVFVDCRFD